MNIQSYADELDYVNAQLSSRGEGDKSFLGTFCECCLRADEDNYELVRQALHRLMKKYPADPVRLAVERDDRGAATEEDVALIRDARLAGLLTTERRK